MGDATPSGTRPLRVLMLIGRFDVGGIQRQVMATATGLAARGHTVRVLSIYPTGRFADELRSAGIDVRTLQRRSRRDLRSLLRGAWQTRRFEPDVLYSYHVLPNLVGLLYRLWCPRAGLVWGLRATDLDQHGLLKRTQFRVSRFVARIPDGIIANSGAVRDFHARAGYPHAAISVIPNGIDTDRFRPDHRRRASIRAELGLGDGSFVVGVVAQLRGKKGHRQLLRALPAVLAEYPEVVVLMVGDGPERAALQAEAERLGVQGSVRWLGYRSDTPALYSALDLLCLPSTFGEGFPNVVGEALACGVGVVATDVGGTREVVGPHGAVVAPSDPAALGRAISWAARQRASGKLAWPVDAASARVRRAFSTDVLLARTEERLREAVEDRQRKRRRPGRRSRSGSAGGTRVLYVASIDLTASTGPAVNEREALLALRRLLGDDLFVIVGEPEGTDPDLDEIRPDLLLPGGGDRLSPRHVLAHQLAKARLLRREVRRRRPSCVVARLDVMPLGLLLGTLGLPAPVVLKTVSTSTLRLDRRKHGRLIPALHRLLVRAVARKVAGADTITVRRRPIVAAELGLPESRVAVIDNGVNVERFRLIPQREARERCGVDPEAVVLGYAGAQAWTRGGRHLIDAAKALRAEFARPRIVIVGGGESIERLRQHAQALGHADICVFPGLVPYEDVVWWMNCLDVAVSVETGERALREGHAQQKVRQYTAAGVPVVSAIGGNEYLAEHGVGSLVDPDDRAAMEEALIRWGGIAGRERADLRQRARAFAASHLTVEALNRSRIEFWDRIGSQSGQPRP